MEACSWPGNAETSLARAWLHHRVKQIAGLEPVCAYPRTRSLLQTCKDQRAALLVHLLRCARKASKRLAEPALVVTSGGLHSLQD